MVYPTSHNVDPVYNTIARALARRRSYLLGLAPTFTTSNEHHNRFQSSTEHQTPAPTPPFQHHTPTMDISSFPTLEESPWAQPVPIGSSPHPVQPYLDNEAYPEDLEIFGSIHGVPDGYAPPSQPQTWEGYYQYHSSEYPPNPDRPLPPTPPSAPFSDPNHPLVVVPDDVDLFQPDHVWGTPPTVPGNAPPSKNVPKAYEPSESYSPMPPPQSSTPIPITYNAGSVQGGSIKVETEVAAPLAALEAKANDKADAWLKPAGTNDLRPTREAEINKHRSNQLGLDERPSSGFTTVERDSVFYKPHAGRNDIEHDSPQKTKNGNQGKRYDLDVDPRLLASTSFMPKISSSKRKMRDEPDLETSPPPPSKKQRKQRTLEGHISGPANANANASSSQIKLDSFVRNGVHDQGSLQGSEHTSL